MMGQYYENKKKYRRSSNTRVDYLYDKKYQLKETERKLAVWLRKWDERVPWWLKFRDGEYYY